MRREEEKKASEKKWKSQGGEQMTTGGQTSQRRCNLASWKLQSFPQLQLFPPVDALSSALYLLLTLPRDYATASSGVYIISVSRVFSRVRLLHPLFPVPVSRLGLDLLPSRWITRH